ncbi:hypothetical protein VdG1_00673 [Verticillium dahliae VDG1]|nr:hypothetical protein VdG1_00673 [Verticillium dahliae VDG1]
MSGTGAPAGGSTGGYGGPPQHRSYEERAVAREQMMSNIRDSSQQDRRVYVGNLSYDVKWHHLKDFMRQSGEVLFADVLLLPNGIIVEYATREQAQNAVATLSNQNLMGRLIYVREDREAEPRFIGATATRGGYGGPGGPGGHGGMNPALALLVPLPYTVGWQDLKDLFRQAARNGAVIRADVHLGPDGRPKGTGIVMFESPDDARIAIEQFNGYDWQGRLLELPWSTSNEDLVELFTTIGKVEKAEIQYEPSGRSRGTGVVQFDAADTADTAIQKFQGYQYGGRPLGLSFVRYLSPPGAGGDSMDTDAHAGLTQDQIM